MECAVHREDALGAGLPCSLPLGSAVRPAPRRPAPWGSASKEAFIFATVMLLGVIVPVGLTFYYANILGVFWWIILLAYSSLLSSAIYLIYRYREITEIRGYFTDEEFNQRFKKELWLVRFMDKARRFLIH